MQEQSHQSEERRLNEFVGCFEDVGFYYELVGKQLHV